MTLFNRVSFSSSTSGTSDFTVGSAITGYRTPAGAGVTDGTIVSYTAQSADKTEWETGTGAYNTGVVARTTVRESSTGSKVSFTTAPTVWLDFHAQDTAAIPIFTPGGRLTLVSNTPVLTSDQLAKTTIYYTPYLHDQIAIYNGSAFVAYTFAEMSVALDATNAVNAKAYDLFVAFDGTTMRLGYGPAWTSNTARSAAISSVNGRWVNTAQITLRYDSTHTFTVDASKAIYVGTFYTTAAGQTGMEMLPAAASGGTNNFLGLYNAHNRIMVQGRSMDSSTSWTVGGAWRAAANSNSNRVSYIDGLGESAVDCRYTVLTFASQDVTVTAGMLLDATTGTPTLFDSLQTNASGGGKNNLLSWLQVSSLGFHYIQAMEGGGASGATQYGNGTQALIVQLMM